MTGNLNSPIKASLATDQTLMKHRKYSVFDLCFIRG
jgi:hypothetical protein